MKNTDLLLESARRLDLSEIQTQQVYDIFTALDGFSVVQFAELSISGDRLVMCGAAQTFCETDNPFNFTCYFEPCDIGRSLIFKIIYQAVMTFDKMNAIDEERSEIHAQKQALTLSFNKEMNALNDADQCLLLKRQKVETQRREIRICDKKLLDKINWVKPCLESMK